VLGNNFSRLISTTAWSFEPLKKLNQREQVLIIELLKLEKALFTLK